MRAIVSCLTAQARVGVQSSARQILAALPMHTASFSKGGNEKQRPIEEVAFGAFRVHYR